ncbi:MAG: hypothetical protein ABI068_09805, partial [Ktedonobacterales bacterium]
MSTSFDGDGAETAETSSVFIHNGHMQTPDDATLSDDLRLTHQRLVADGVSWRRRLPPSERLIERARVELAARTTSAISAESAERQSLPPSPTVPLPDQHPTPKGYIHMRETPRPPTTSTRQSSKTPRWRAWVGAAAAVVVVGLLVGLLDQNVVARRTGPGAGSQSATATPPPATPLMPSPQ